MKNPIRAWTWTTPSGTRELSLFADLLVEVNSARRPSRSERTVIEGFTRPHALFIGDLEDYYSVVRALAEHLDPAQLHDPLLEKRRRFLCAYDPTKLEPTQYHYEDRWSLSRARTVHAELTPFGLRVLPERPEYEPPALALPDDVFFHGPPAVGLPLELRDDLRRRLLAATGDADEQLTLTLADAFPTFDYAKIEQRSWEFNETDRGSERAALSGAAVVRGYQYGHDMGYDTYAVERVWTRAPEVRLSAPEEVERGIFAGIAAALEQR